MKNEKRVEIKQGIILFIAGVAGVLAAMPLLPQLLKLQPGEPPLPIYVMQILSLLQSSVLLLLMVVLGSFFSHRVNLASPIVRAIARSETVSDKVRDILLPGMAGGILGAGVILIFFAVMSGHLPAEFLASAENFSPPWYTKILYGGITEEILIRWGLMSFLVWGCFRLTQRKNENISSYNYVVAIVLSALIFGAAHLPMAFMLSPVITAPLILYVVLGNAFFGFIGGFLYWKRGLECAVLAHMTVHITVIAVEVFL